ncbi:MAG: hypothetical protein R2795_20065 [Saprospiraceae bacterium]
MKTYYLLLLLLLGIGTKAAWAQQAGQKIDLDIQATTTWSDYEKNYDTPIGMGYLNGKYFSAGLNENGFVYTVKNKVTISRYDSATKLEKEYEFELMHKDEPATPIYFFTTQDKAYLIYRSKSADKIWYFYAWEIDPTTLTQVGEPIELLSKKLPSWRNKKIDRSEDGKYLTLTLVHGGTFNRPLMVHVSCFDNNLQLQYQQEAVLAPDVRDININSLQLDESGGVTISLFINKSTANSYKKSKAAYLYFSEHIASPYIEYVNSSKGRYVRSASATTDDNHLLMCTVFAKKKATKNADWFTVVERIPKPDKNDGKPTEITLPMNGGIDDPYGDDRESMRSNSCLRKFLHFSYWDGYGYLLVTEDLVVNTSSDNRSTDDPDSHIYNIIYQYSIVLTAMLLDENLTPRWVTHFPKDISPSLGIGRYLVEQTPQHVSLVFDAGKSDGMDNGIGILRMLPDGGYDMADFQEKERSFEWLWANKAVKLDTGKFLTLYSKGILMGKRSLGVLNINSTPLPASPKE